MAEIKLFELRPTVHERTSSEVVLEKELQNTILLIFLGKTGCLQ